MFQIIHNSLNEKQNKTKHIIFKTKPTLKKVYTVLHWIFNHYKLISDLEVIFKINLIGLQHCDISS